MRVVFMGNGAFGIPTLRRLANSFHEVSAVITNPDKPAGRGYLPTSTPIKAEAQRLGLPIWEVARLKEPDFIARLAALRAQAYVVVAYRLLPEAIWKLPARGALNLHPSLLPAYRGPAPIPWTIIHGETETGITIFRIREGIDTGEIVLQERYPLPVDWTGGQLEQFLAEVGADLMLKALEGLVSGSLRPHPQPAVEGAPYAPKLDSAQTRLVWDKPARAVYNFIRALSPTPAAWTTLQGRRLQVLAAKVHSERATHYPPGTLWQEQGIPLVACGAGLIELVEVRPEGRKTMSGQAFASGFIQKQTIRLS